MVKVGDKFIIEVKEQVKPKLFDTGLVAYDGAAIFFFEDTLKQCERYNETEAYKKGYAKAMEDIQNAVRVFRVMNNEDRKEKILSLTQDGWFNLKTAVERSVWTP